MNNIFKGLLFLHGYRLPFESIEDPDADAAGADSYASGYGNRAASGRVFAPLGHGHSGHRAASAAPVEEVCTAGGCG